MKNLIKVNYNICIKYLIVSNYEKEILKKYLQKVDKAGKSEEIKGFLQEFLQGRNDESLGVIFAKLYEKVDTS